MPDVKEKLVDVLAEVFCGNWGDYGCDGCRDNRDGMCAAPEFADKLIAHGVVIPVRCKDCKHTDTDGMKDPAIYCQKWDYWEIPEDFYCAYGERRTDG